MSAKPHIRGDATFLKVASPFFMYSIRTKHFLVDSRRRELYSHSRNNLFKRNEGITSRPMPSCHEVNELGNQSVARRRVVPLSE